MAVVSCGMLAARRRQLAGGGEVGPDGLRRRRLGIASSGLENGGGGRQGSGGWGAALDHSKIDADYDADDDDRPDSHAPTEPGPLAAEIARLAFIQEWIVTGRRARSLAGGRLDGAWSYRRRLYCLGTAPRGLGHARQRSGARSPGTSVTVTHEGNCGFQTKSVAVRAPVCASETSCSQDTGPTCCPSTAPVLA